MKNVRILVFSGAVVVAGALGSSTGAMGGDLYRFSYTEHGRGVNDSSGELPVTAGMATSMSTEVIEAGSSVGWHHHDNDAPTLVIVKRGSAVEYTSCTDKRQLVAGRTYLHQADHHKHPMLLRNEGTEPVELLVVYFNVSPENPSGVPDGRPDPPPADCPTLY